MKKNIIALIIVSFLSAAFTTKESQDPTILEQIANANGYQNWKNVNEIQFTFNVDRDTTHFERKWTWNPKTNDITATSNKESLSYNWATMDSTAIQTNSGFINDKFWLLAPYQLIWDADNITYTHLKEEEAPINKKTMQKLTIVYGSEGGYTPGDAYDFYFEEDLTIQEWVFRKSNQIAPSMITSFEDYKLINGLHIATMHKMREGSFKLYFSDIVVK